MGHEAWDRSKESISNEVRAKSASKSGVEGSRLSGRSCEPSLVPSVIRECEGLDRDVVTCPTNAVDRIGTHTSPRRFHAWARGPGSLQNPVPGGCRTEAPRSPRPRSPARKGRLLLRGRATPRKGSACTCGRWTRLGVSLPFDSGPQWHLQKPFAFRHVAVPRGSCPPCTWVEPH